MIGKLKIVVVLLLIVVAVSLAPKESFAQAGANLSLPFARRSQVTQGYDAATHQGIDYRAARGTPVVAAHAGTVIFIDNGWVDGTHPLPGQPPDYGNYIEIDHGNNYVTRYAHLSQNSFQVVVGDQVSRGQYIARSDNTGTSTADHLHFELRHNGNPVNPYAGAWVSGLPIPMGFRDQSGAVHGPYALDYSQIHAKWLALNGKPGAPVGDDWTSGGGLAGAGSLTIWHIQEFEQGYIRYTAGSEAEYVPYAKTYLPDVRVAANNWNSSVVVRNTATFGDYVTLLVYYPDGSLADSRVYDPLLGQNASWTFGAASLADPTEWVNPINNLSGSTVVAANPGVAVLVRDASANGVTSYTGMPAAGSGAGWDQPGATVYVPAALKQWGWVSTLYLQNTGVAVATADIRFYDINGNCQHTLEDVSIAPNGRAAVDLAGIAQLGSFSGSAVVSADQAVAVTVRQDNANGAGYSDYNAFSSGADRLYLPSLLKGYYNWNSAFQVQNVGDRATVVTVRYSNGLVRTLLSVPAKGYAMVSQSTEVGLPNNWAGSAQLSTDNGQPIVAIVNQQNTTAGRRSHQSYSALLGGAANLFAPFVANNLDGDGWKTGLQVQNVDSTAAQVRRSYYYKDGSGPVGVGTDDIDPGESAVYAADSIPSGVQLSASVVSLNGQRIGGICKLSRSSGAGDIGGSYNLPGH